MNRNSSQSSDGEHKGEEDPSSAEFSTGYHLLLVQEIFRTFRVLFICTAVVLGMYFIVNGVVSILTDDKNPWVQVVSIVCAMILGVVGAQTPIFVKLSNFRKYIRNHANRTADLEASVDQTRTSSELNKDGTTPLD